MNPLAILLTLGGAAGLAAALGYFVYQALNENEPQRVMHPPRSGSHGPAYNTSCDVGTCAICRRTIDINQRMTLPCKHVFHRSCVTLWRESRESSVRTCPTCPLHYCTICLTGIKANNNKTLNCKHSFHKQCIEKWLESKKICPNCNKAI